MKAFFMGADEILQLRWVNKVRSLGWDIEHIGGVCRETNPQGISLPSETELLIILKDQISHKVRDKFKGEADGKNIITIEVSSKVSKSISSIVTHGEYIPRLWENSPEIDEEDAVTRFGAEDNDDGILVIPFDDVWQSLRWDRASSGSAKRLTKSWVKNARKRDVPFIYYKSNGESEVKLGSNVLPPTSRLSECHNPLAVISNKIKNSTGVSVMYASHWLLGSADESFLFKSKHEIDRALKMTFGITTRDVDKGLWSDLIAGCDNTHLTRKELSKTWEEKYPRVDHSETSMSIKRITVDSEELRLPASSKKELESILSQVSLRGSFIIRINYTDSDYSLSIKKIKTDSKMTLQYVDEVAGMRCCRLSNTFIILIGADMLDIAKYSDSDPTKPKISTTVFSETKTVLRVT